MDEGQGGLVVVVYHSNDEYCWGRVHTHLLSLVRDEDIIDIQVDAVIPDWKKLSEKLRATQLAKVAVLLVSADLLASGSFVSNNWTSLLELDENGFVIILPLIVSPCRFLSIERLSQFYPVNDPSKPFIALERWEQEQTLKKLTDDIEIKFRSVAKSETRGSEPAVVYPD